MYDLIAMQVDLAGGWQKVWGAVTGSFPGLPTLLNVLAVLIAVGGIASWLWRRRRNVSQGDNHGLFGALLVAAMFAAPDIIFPIGLWLADGIINWILALTDGMR